MSRRLEFMKAQLLKRTGPVEDKLLELVDLPVPEPGPGQILVRIFACGMCHTEIDEIEGRRQPRLPVIPGHQIVGRVAARGKGADRFAVGERVGMGWINRACGECDFCLSGRENLCPRFCGTGSDADGGYAEFTMMHQDFAQPVPEVFTDIQAAPLFCAGAVGYRAFKLTGIRPGQSLGLFGFGASAHIVIQAARHLGHPVYAFTREPEKREQARRLGAVWAGGLDERPDVKVSCAIEFTPVGETVAQAMDALEKGGRLVINAIRKRTPVQLDYARHMWQEKEIKSVANVTRSDIAEFLELAAKIPIIPEVREFPLEEANQALLALKQGKIVGAGVFRIG